jgi:hypothetical protein
MNKTSSGNGWALPMGSRKYHYFRCGISLCGGWLMTGPCTSTLPRRKTGPCAMCWRVKGAKPR